MRSVSQSSRFLAAALWCAVLWATPVQAGAPAVAMYVAQFDSEGVQGRITVNGLAVVERDGKAWASGGSVLNPFFRPGKNVVTVDLAALPGAKDVKVRVELGPREGERLWAVDTLQGPVSLPLRHQITIDLPGFPLTALWSPTLPGGPSAEAEILKALGQVRTTLKTAIAKKDAAQVSAVFRPGAESTYLSLGRPFESAEFEDHYRTAVNEAKGVESESPALKAPDLAITAVPDSNLYQVRRRDGAPVILFKLKASSAVVLDAPVMGRTAAGWTVLRN